MGTLLIIAVVVSALFGCWVLFLNHGEPVYPIEIPREKPSHHPDRPQEPAPGVRHTPATQRLPETVDAG